MERSYFFNSSLPRAGSTLLSNIIAQNPQFYCTPTSGFLDLILGARASFQQSPNFKTQDVKLMDVAFLHFCRASIDGYFNAITQKPYVFDKSRAWITNYRFTNMFYNTPKMVCMVRDLRSIYASMEKNFRKNPHKENHIQNPIQLQGTTLRKRVDIWATTTPVGTAIDGLRDVIDQKIDKNILFIRYEDLMSNPDLVSTKYPLLSASWFFTRCLPKCDAGSTRAVVESVTKCVNGGLIGIDERYKHFVEFYKLLS
jgi:hypothetical protein